MSFRNFPVAKKRMNTTGGGEYQDFPSKVFLYHSAAKLRRGTNLVMCFRKFPFAKKLMVKWGRGIKIFCRNCFVSQRRKIS